MYIDYPAYIVDNLIKNGCKKISANMGINEIVDTSQFGIIFILESVYENGRLYGYITTLHTYIPHGTSYISSNGFKTQAGGLFKISLEGILTRISATSSINNCDIYAL